MAAGRRDDPASAARGFLWVIGGGFLIWVFAIAGFVSACRYVAGLFS